MKKSLTDSQIQGRDLSQWGYSEILNTMNDIVTIFDLQHNAIYMNQALERQLGYKIKDVLGKKSLDRIHPEDVHFLKDTIEHGVLSGGEKRAEYRYLHANGHYLWLEGLGKAFYDRNGQVTGYMVIARDIHQRKLLEENLIITSTVTTNSIDAVIITDLENNILYVNNAFEELSGYTKEEVLEKKTDIFKSGKHDILFYQEIWKTIGEKGSWQGEIWNKKKDGSLIIQWSRIKAIINDQGEPIRYAYIYSDITDKKRSEDRLLHELEIAKNIQISVLPKPILTENISISGKYLPSQKLGGDMYYWDKIDENRYLVLLLDVVGHGVASSLIAMSIRSLLAGILMSTSEPLEVLQTLNKHMHNKFRSNIEDPYYFFTAQYAIIDPQTRTLEYSVAGAPPILILDQNNQVKRLLKGGLPIGMMKESIYEKETIKLEKGNKIILMTDGLIDGGRYPFLQGLKEVEMDLKRAANLKNQEICEELYARRKEKIKEFEDDISIVSIELK